MTEIKVDDKELARLVSALKAESDGQKLKADLVRNLREVAIPARDAARGEILSAPSRSTVEPSLRAAIASATQVSVHLSGDHPGVAVRVGTTGMPRGFSLAGRRFNAQSWRHPVHGTGKWVTQRGKPGWFDDTMQRFQSSAEKAAGDAMDAVAKRIDHATKG